MVFDFQVAVLRWRASLSHHGSRGITTVYRDLIIQLLTQDSIDEKVSLYTHLPEHLLIITSTLIPQLGIHEISCTFRLANLDKWNMILGMPFLSKFNIIIDIGK